MAEDDSKTEIPVDPRVRLTPDQATAITDHINRKAIAPNDACPVCGDPYNVVAPDVFRVDAMTNPTMIGGAHQPLVATICHGCGFVRLFNRIIVDHLIEQHGKSQAKPETKAPEPEAGDGG